MHELCHKTNCKIEEAQVSEPQIDKFPNPPLQGYICIYDTYMHIFTASVADWTFVEPIIESFGPSRDLNFLILFPKDLKFK